MNKIALISVFYFVFIWSSLDLLKATDEIEASQSSPKISSFLEDNFQYDSDLSDLSGLQLSEIESLEDSDPSVVSANLSKNSFYLELAEALSTNKKITVLNLRECNLDDECGVPLFKMTWLTGLDISQNKLSSKSVGLFTTLQNLTVLICAGNPLGNTLPKALSDHTKLTYLDASSCSLDDTCIDDLIALKSLRKLILKGNKFTGSGQKKLVNAGDNRSLEIIF
ncbi:leucine-rich repeat domain-containing protein [Candidatus Nucleicultrix amoebiphila]|jgi:Leucine-rich repeat (LRR) protein|uniref:Uncharacterized protein n=1 Tax=Candidatus Nucleicultrix amoebiphila FS5 TaxID=1414854 RepID=A0A1W6N4D0_9PROT|nr:hypothetical protein [Candidatus Nucleicultrix amoebiphila]ARN84713.1 hypothetical protein GQ61_04685 [Candidatus Nucleicultrix amoebiphila FS5]